MLVSLLGQVSRALPSFLEVSPLRQVSRPPTCQTTYRGRYLGHCHLARKSPYQGRYWVTATLPGSLPTEIVVQAPLPGSLPAEACVQVPLHGSLPTGVGIWGIATLHVSLPTRVGIWDTATLPGNIPAEVGISGQVHPKSSLYDREDQKQSPGSSCHTGNMKINIVVYLIFGLLLQYLTQNITQFAVFMIFSDLKLYSSLFTFMQ